MIPEKKLKRLSVKELEFKKRVALAGMRRCKANNKQITDELKLRKA